MTNNKIAFWSEEEEEEEECDAALNEDIERE
jgi:hypothetical protein